MTVEERGAPKSRPTVLVTGGAGFIGSHLCSELLARGHRVLVIDDLSTGSLANIQHLTTAPGFHFARASIHDTTVLDRLASEAQIIVHLAAAVGVKLVVDRPVHTIDTNITGTASVLRAALRYGCRMLIASTSEVYGKGSKIPFAEGDDLLLGSSDKARWGYAASKLVDEFLGLAYQREYGLPVVLFRLFNTVGPRQTGEYGMVMPRFVRQALQGQPITVYGDGEQRRCFCYVEDAVAAILGLSEHPQAPGRVFNIGGTEEIAIGALAQRVIEMCASGSQIVRVPYSEAYGPGFEDMHRRLPDIARIRSLLGWQPKKALTDILREVIRHEAASLGLVSPV